jgi:hypothetical protein
MRPKQTYPRIVLERCGRNGLPPDAADLCDSLLLYDITKRCTANQAIAHHPFFRTPPYPEVPERMPKYEEKHKWVFRRNKKKEQHHAEQSETAKKVSSTTEFATIHGKTTQSSGRPQIMSTDAEIQQSFHASVNYDAKGGDNNTTISVFEQYDPTKPTEQQHQQQFIQQVQKQQQLRNVGSTPHLMSTSSNGSVLYTTGVYHPPPSLEESSSSYHHDYTTTAIDEPSSFKRHRYL